MKTNSIPLLLASIATFAMKMTGYSQSPPKVPVRRRMSPLRLPWRDAAMLAAILLPCAAIASPPVVKHDDDSGCDARWLRARLAHRLLPNATSAISVRLGNAVARHRAGGKAAQGEMSVRTKGWSDQARADRSVSRPSHWLNPEVIEASVACVEDEVLPPTIQRSVPLA